MKDYPRRPRGRFHRLADDVTVEPRTRATRDRKGRNQRRMASVEIRNVTKKFELAIADRDVDSMDDPMAAEFLGNVADLDRRHPPLIPPFAIPRCSRPWLHGNIIGQPMEPAAGAARIVLHRLALCAVS